MIAIGTGHRLRIFLPAVLAGMATACGGGGHGSASVSGAGGGSTTSTGSGSSSTSTTPAAPVSNAAGIWSGTLTPDDTTQPPPTGWLVIGTDGSFSLDTDVAQFSGTSQLQGQAFTATTTANPYTSQIAAGSSFHFDGMLADTGVLTGTYSGGGGQGTIHFQLERAISAQAASLSDAASTYHGEFWIKDSRQSADITVTDSGALTASAGGCAFNGTIQVADASHNSYHWSARATGCATNGTAEGTGFMIENYFLYLMGSIGGQAVWIGGADSDAPDD